MNFESAASVKTASGNYDIFVHDQAIENVGEICRALDIGNHAFIITDTEINKIFGEQLVSILSQAGYTTKLYAINAGEDQKNLETVEHLYNWLLENHVERSDFVICLGGGVVTDLGGYVAATTLRGIPFIHVPTTLLGMVDAAIGGKTGVAHQLGKNLIGAFAQPAAVVSDPKLLSTLPIRQIRDGLAELIKHGLILDKDLVDLLEKSSSNLKSLIEPHFIAKSSSIKAGIVSADERESSKRMLLNYGHTVGHAIEACTGYQTYRHGEAVAVGMHIAGKISHQLGLLSEEELNRQQHLITSCGLPSEASDVRLDDVLKTMRSDKKMYQGTLSWILLNGIGNAIISRNVSEATFRSAAETILG